MHNLSNRIHHRQDKGYLQLYLQLLHLVNQETQVRETHHRIVYGLRIMILQKKAAFQYQIKEFVRFPLVISQDLMDVFHLVILIIQT